VVGFAAVYFVLEVPKVDHSHWREKIAKIDFLGALFLILAVVSILVGLDSGSNMGWTTMITVVSLSLAPFFFAVFLLVEMKVASHPFAPGHIIFDRSLFAAYMANFFGVAGHIGPLFFMSLFFQAVQGYNATQSGLLLIPCMVAAVVASIAGGLVIKKTGRYYRVTVLGFGLLLLGIPALAVATFLESTAGVVVGQVISTLGAGSGITTTLIAMLSNAAVEDMAVVVACSYLFRSLGSSIGISTSSAVLQQVLRAQLAARLENGDQARYIEERVRESLDYIKELPPQIAAEVRISYRYGILGAFAPPLLYLILAFVATFFIREKAIGK
jgi:MFS family permease